MIGGGTGEGIPNWGREYRHWEMEERRRDEKGREWREDMADADGLEWDRNLIRRAIDHAKKNQEGRVFAGVEWWSWMGGWGADFSLRLEGLGWTSFIDWFPNFSSGLGLSG